MAVDIDSLQIEIEATSSDAAAKIDALAAALASLKTVAKGGAGLTTVSNQMQALANAAKLINSSSLNTAKIKEIKYSAPLRQTFFFPIYFDSDVCLFVLRL